MGISLWGPGRGPVKKHFQNCDILVNFDCIDILAPSREGEHVLNFLRSMYVYKNINLVLNANFLEAEL